MTKFFILLVILTPLVGFSQSNIIKRKAGELVIQGSLNNIKEPVAYIYMICLDCKSGGIDSTRVINNKYRFKVQTGVTTLITLYTKDPLNPKNLLNKYMLTLLAEPASLIITSTDSFPNANVKGSRAYLEYKKLELQSEPFYSSLSALYSNYMSKKKDGDKEGMMQLQNRIDSTRKNFHNMYYQYIEAQPSSLLIPYALNTFVDGLHSNSSNEEVDKATLIYSKLSESDKNSYYGKRIQKKLDSYKISIGMMAPAFIQNDTLGNPVSLSTFKGKFVLLDFWASWCIPCRKDNPNLVKAFNAYKDKGFTILSISLDRPGDKYKWMRAIQLDGLTWTHVSDLKYWDNDIAKLYKINSIPQNFLLDPSGKIVGKGLHGSELEKKLKEIFH